MLGNAVATPIYPAGLATLDDNARRVGQDETRMMCEHLPLRRDDAGINAFRPGDAY